MTGRERAVARQLINQACRERVFRGRQSLDSLARFLARGGQHGTSAYRYGCRCPECRASQKTYDRAKYIAKNNDAGRPSSHGGSRAPRKEEGS